MAAGGQSRFGFSSPPPPPTQLQFARIFRSWGPLSWVSVPVNRHLLLIRVTGVLDQAVWGLWRWEVGGGAFSTYMKLLSVQKETLPLLINIRGGDNDFLLMDFWRVGSRIATLSTCCYRLSLIRAKCRPEDLGAAQFEAEMKWPNVATNTPAVTYAVSTPPLTEAWFVILLSPTLLKRTPAWRVSSISEHWLRLLFLFFFFFHSPPCDNLQLYQRVLRSRLESVKSSGADFAGTQWPHKKVSEMLSVFYLYGLFICLFCCCCCCSMRILRERDHNCPSDICSSNHLPLSEKISSSSVFFISVMPYRNPRDFLSNLSLQATECGFYSQREPPVGFRRRRTSSQTR